MRKIDRIILLRASGDSGKGLRIKDLPSSQGRATDLTGTGTAIQAGDADT